MLPPQTFYTQVVHEKGQKLQIWTWAPYRVQCPCLKSQHQLSWILLTFATAIMGTLSKTVRFPLYPSQWVSNLAHFEEHLIISDSDSDMWPILATASDI